MIQLQGGKCIDKNKLITPLKKLNKLYTSGDWCIQKITNLFLVINANIVVSTIWAIEIN